MPLGWAAWVRRGWRWEDGSCRVECWFSFVLGVTVMAGVVFADDRERSWTVEETERLSRRWMPLVVGPSSIDSSSSPSTEALLPVCGSTDTGFELIMRD